MSFDPITRETRWRQQTRLNVENAIEFIASKANSIETALVYNQDTWSFSIFINSYLNTEQVIFGNQLGNVAQLNWNIRVANGSTFKFRYDNISYSVPGFKSNVWFHLVIVLDGVGLNAKIYVNTKLVFNQVVTGPTTYTGEPFVFGKYSNLTTTQAYEGLMQNASFFDRELTEDEIEFIFNNGGILPDSTHSAVLGHWPLTQRIGWRKIN